MAGVSAQDRTRHFQREVALQIADALGGMEVAPDTSLARDHFSVHLGTDRPRSAVRPAVFFRRVLTQAPINADGVTCVN